MKPYLYHIHRYIKDKSERPAMLQNMRNFAHSWIVKVLMGLLMVSFAIWGIGDIFRGNSLRKTVAKVGDSTITVMDVNALFEKALVEARQQLSPSLTAQQARRMGLLDSVLQREISSRLLDMDIAKQGIDLAPKDVLAAFASNPQFQDKDGNFDKQLFRRFLEQQRLSEAAFIVRGRETLSRQILLGAIQIPVTSKTSVDALFKARGQKRVLEVVTVDPSKIGGIDAPDEKTLRDLYDKNKGLFEAPEYRSVTIATLSADSFEKDLSVSDEQLRKEYDLKRAQFTISERRDIVQVVFQEEPKAKELAEKAREAKDLLSAAKAVNAHAVPLDGIEKKSLMPELAEAVFALRENEIGAPIKTQLGWHVLQLKKVAVAETQSFDKVKDKLREEMLRDQSVEAATRVINQLDDQLAAGNSLDDIADGMRLRLVKIPAIDVNGRTPSGTAPTELPGKDSTVKSAFAQNAGETSPIDDDGAGLYFVVRTDDIVPSGIKPFEKVKNDVASAWKKSEQTAKAKAKAEKIAKALSDGVKLSSVEENNGVSVRTTGALSLLGDMDKELPSSLIEKAFRIKKGETAVDDYEGKQYVARLASISDIDASKPDPRKNAIEKELKKAEADELVQQYIQHLHAVYPVKIKESVMQNLRQRED